MADTYLRKLIGKLGLDRVAHREQHQKIGIDLPIAVINLAHRTDRWQALESRMTAVGLDRLIKVPAVEGASLALDEISGLLAQPAAKIEAAPRDHFSLTRPAIGCYLSHLAIWQWVIEADVPRVLVFEDDATPAPGFDAEQFRTVYRAIPGDKGLVFLGRIIMDGLAERHDGQALARLYFFNGTFAYVITPAAARALMPHLLPLDGHIDHQISTMLVKLRHEFAAYYTEPAFFEPDWSLRSDCYVPLTEETEANRDLGRLFAAHRALLGAEGRPLLPPFAG